MPLPRCGQSFCAVLLCLAAAELCLAAAELCLAAAELCLAAAELRLSYSYDVVCAAATLRRCAAALLE